MNTHLACGVTESAANQNVVLLKYSSGNGTMFGLFGSQAGQEEDTEGPTQGERSPSTNNPGRQEATSPGVKINSSYRPKAVSSQSSGAGAPKSKTQLKITHSDVKGTVNHAVNGQDAIITKSGTTQEPGSGPIIREDDSGYHSRENSLEKNWCNRNRKCVIGDKRLRSEGLEASREVSGGDLSINPLGPQSSSNNNKKKGGTFLSSSSVDSNDNMKAHRSSDDLLQAIRARRAKSPAVRPKPDVDASKSKLQKTVTGSQACLVPKPVEGNKTVRNEKTVSKEDGFGARRNYDKKAHSRDSSVEDRRRKPKPRISIAQPQDVVKEMQRQRAWSHSRQGSREDLLSEDIHVMGSDRPAWGSELVRLTSDNLDDLPWSQGRVSSLEDLLEDCGAKTRLFGSGDNHLSVLKCLTGGSTSPVEKEVRTSVKDSKSKTGGTNIGSPPNAKTLLNKLNGWIHDHHNNNRVDTKKETKASRLHNNSNQSSKESPPQQMYEQQNSVEVHRTRARSPHSTVGTRLLQSQKICPEKVQIQEEKPKKIIPKRHAPPVPKSAARTPTESAPTTNLDNFIDVCDEALIYEQRAREREENAREAQGTAQRSHRRTAREVKRSRSLKDLFRGRSKSRNRDQDDFDSSPTIASFADKWNDLLRNGLPGGALLDQYRMVSLSLTFLSILNLISASRKQLEKSMFLIKV